MLCLAFWLGPCESVSKRHVSTRAGPEHQRSFDVITKNKVSLPCVDTLALICWLGPMNSGGAAAPSFALAAAELDISLTVPNPVPTSTALSTAQACPQDVAPTVHSSATQSRAPQLGQRHLLKARTGVAKRLIRNSDAEPGALPGSGGRSRSAAPHANLGRDQARHGQPSWSVLAWCS